MFRRVFLATAALSVSAVAVAPTAGAGDPAFQPVTTSREMVVTANPLATAAGERVLRTGGTAADAMIAVQTVLGLVEPQSSGIGGGAFVVYHDAATGTTTTVDAREKAPSAATEGRFLGLGFTTAWQSGLSVGVPGVPRLLEYMHEHYGKRPWQTLFNPAKTLAQDGFALTERTSSQAAGLLLANPSCDDRLFFRDPTTLAYFADPVTCEAKPAGTIVTNPAYAATMKALARGGADAFYEGEIAEAIAAAVQTDPNIPGDMTTADLAAYDVVERDPVCLDYRGYDVCGMGPPSSGGLAVGQILGILENFDLAGFAAAGDGPLDVDVVHLFTQAGRLAFADRNLYVGDPDFVTVPAAGMLDEDYLASRAALITDTDMGLAAPGTPPGDFDPSAPDTTATASGTSHISIVDRYGNALSMTTSVESSFGNGVMVHGFLLNNQLTDFSFNPVAADGTPIANRVQPNKRPRSSMSPTIVFGPSGALELVTGSPGGARIIGYTAQSVMNHIDFGLDPQLSVAIPHFMNLNGSTAIEPPIPGVTVDYDAAALKAALEARRHTVSVIRQESGLSVIQVTPDELIGGADLRRDGTVGGR
jgi:gamma-glutamyltranspeptidase / glutathione hydrolase